MILKNYLNDLRTNVNMPQSQITKLVFMITLLVISGCNNAENDGLTSNEFNLANELDDLVNKPGSAPTEIPGVQMVLIKNGEVIFEHAAGWARIEEEHNTPLTTNHKVRVASISKLILTVAFMTLVEDGLVDLDADISNYIGFQLRNPNFPDIPITSRQLLAHTSSIRDGSHYFMGLNGDFRDFFIPNESEESASHYENGAHFANGEGKNPGDYFTYSNLNFGILSGIIENITQTRMDLFVKETLFDPLGINASFSVCTLSDDNYSSLATLYRRGQGGETWTPDGPWISQVDGDPIGCYYESAQFVREVAPDLSPLNDYEIGKNPTLFSPQGGLRASSKDLAKLMLLLMQGGKWEDKQIISQSSIKQMLSPVWQYDETKLNGHTGGEAVEGDENSSGMMTTYGLSTHIIDLQDWGLLDHSRKLYGHLGSAYGLQGQFWYDPITNDGLVAFITGVGDDPGKAKASIPLYAIEEKVLKLGLQGLEKH